MTLHFKFFSFSNREASCLLRGGSAGDISVSASYEEPILLGPGRDLFLVVQVGYKGELR